METAEENLRGWLSLGHEILLKSDERELVNVKYIYIVQKGIKLSTAETKGNRQDLHSSHLFPLGCRTDEIYPFLFAFFPSCHQTLPISCALP